MKKIGREYENWRRLTITWKKSQIEGQQRLDRYIPKGEKRAASGAKKKEEHESLSEDSEGAQATGEPTQAGDEARAAVRRKTGRSAEEQTKNKRTQAQGRGGDDKRAATQKKQATIEGLWSRGSRHASSGGSGSAAAGARTQTSGGDATGAARRRTDETRATDAGGRGGAAGEAAGTQPGAEGRGQSGRPESSRRSTDQSEYDPG